MKRDRLVRAASTIEYAMVIAVVIAALLGIQVYVKRAVCGRWRQAADTFGYGRQYDAPELKIWGK
jgi:Flp pilus assembly pilin Flp